MLAQANLSLPRSLLSITIERPMAETFPSENE